MDEICFITSFYKFFPVPEGKLDNVANSLRQSANELEILGMIILAREGVNGTVSGKKSAIAKFETSLPDLTGSGRLSFKQSQSEKSPFKRFVVKTREEIVTLERTDIVPQDANSSAHLTPEEWDRVLTEEDVVVLDTRNYYETQLGAFQNAIIPDLAHFKDFPEFVQDSGIPKNKKVLMYCTGGIRCEKALFAMKEQGYEEVYQLKGGILKYLEESKANKFKGECFVFDGRVAVDKTLKPSKRWKLCRHCGQPGEELIVCEHCETEEKLCKACLNSHRGKTCSPNCLYQSQMRRSKELKTVEMA